MPVLRDGLASLAAARRGDDLSALVFATSTGGAQNPSNVRNRILRPAVERANERLDEPLPALTPHSLRRTYASILYARGESPVYVMEQMGHTNPNLALARYAQAWTRRDGEVEKLNALVGDWVTAGNSATELGGEAPEIPEIAA